MSEGGAPLSIYGRGLYDSGIKRLKFVCEGGEREITSEWDRKSKCLKCVAPPLSWLLGGNIEVSEE
jgi:hypothetical protein